MTFVVPFDGSPLAQAALSRAVASVGQGISGDREYDVVIVRTPGPSPVTAIREQEPLSASDDERRAED